MCSLFVWGIFSCLCAEGVFPKVLDQLKKTSCGLQLCLFVVFVSEGLLVDSNIFCFTVTCPMHLKSKIKQCPMVWTALGDTGTKLPTQQKIPTLRYRCSDLPPFCLWTVKDSLTLCPFKYVVSTVTCKGFNTFITITGLLSTMCLLMYLEMTMIGKGFIKFFFS